MASLRSTPLVLALVGPLWSASAAAQTPVDQATSIAAPAQAAPVMFDPAQLPVFKGRVQLFTLTPRGDIDGIILADGTEVKTPPHLSTQVAFAVKPGDAITIHGLKAASLPLIQAASVTDDISGRTVIDTGSDKGGRGRGDPPAMVSDPNALPETPMMARIEGRVRMPLHGARGDVNGVLLDDGTVLRLPPPEAIRLASLLQPGRGVVVDGTVQSNPVGKMIDASAIGASADQMIPVEGGRPGKRGRRWRP